MELSYTSDRKKGRKKILKIFINPHTNNNFQVKWSCPRTELIISEGLSKIAGVELVDSELSADYVIWHHVPQNHGQKSFDLINQVNPKKLIVIDSIDENDQWFLSSLSPDKYFLYFKRSLIKVDQQGNRSRIPTIERQYPWDYAILDNFIQPPVEKEIDIGCYLRHSCLYRSLVLNMMSQFPHRNKYVGQVSSGSRSDQNGKVYFDPTYFEYLAKTKIAVSSGPHQWCGDSRGAEAVANKCLYMSNEFFDLMPNPPISGQHWIKFNPLDTDELYNELQFLLIYPRFIKEISENGYERCMKYHTSKARMQYVLQKIEENA